MENRIIQNHGLLEGVQIFAGVIASILTFVGLIANLLMIIALLKSKKLSHLVMTKFIVSLAVSDLLFCSINVGSNAVRYITRNNPESADSIWGAKVCEVFTFFYFANGGVSLANLFLITLNQYVMICHYDKLEKIYRMRNVYLMIAFVWIQTYILSALPLFKIWGEIVPARKKYSCTIEENENGNPKMFFLVFAFGCPFTVIIYCYISMYRKIKQTRKALADTMTLQYFQKKKEKEREQDWRMVKMMLLVFGCFIFTFLPSVIINKFDEDSNYPNVHVFMDILWWLASVINPFIYMIKNKQYRDAVGQIVHGMVCMPERYIDPYTKWHNSNSAENSANSNLVSKPQKV